MADDDVEEEERQRMIQDAMIHLKTVFPDAPPSLLMDVLRANEFNRTRSCSLEFHGDTTPTGALVCNHYDQILSLDATAEALLSMRSGEEGSTSTIPSSTMQEPADHFYSSHRVPDQRQYERGRPQGETQTNLMEDALLIQQDEAIARQLQQELYLEDDIREIERERSLAQSSASQNWSMYGWGESAMSNLQSTVGQLGQGLNQIFQSTYDFLAGSVKQTISSASTCTSDTRAIEDRDDIPLQRDQWEDGREDGISSLPMNSGALEEESARANSSSIDHGGLVRRARRNPHAAHASRGKDD